jgi:hypothetical protein
MLRIRIRCFLTFEYRIRIRDAKTNPNPGSGMNIPDLIIENLSVFGVKNREIQRIVNSGLLTGICKPRNDSK